MTKEQKVYKVLQAYYKDLNDLSIEFGKVHNDDKPFEFNEQWYLAIVGLLDTFDGDDFILDCLEMK